MKIRGHDKKLDDIRLQMSPMIDIVFQLLVFFIMTYRVVAMEGDYNILMPAASETQTMSDQPLDDLLLVKLVAGEDRYIGSIKVTYGTEEKTFAGNPVPDVEQRRPVFNSLHKFVLDITGGGNKDPAAASEIEAEIEIDYDLRYEDTVLAMEAISGYKREDGQIVKLIEKIKFRKGGQ